MERDHYERLPYHTSCGVRTTTDETVSALLREISPPEISPDLAPGSSFSFQSLLPDLENFVQSHQISGIATLHPLSGEIHHVDPDTLSIDGAPVRTLTDLTLLGLNKGQVEMLVSNAANLDYFYGLQVKTVYPTLLEKIEKSTGIVDIFSNRGQPGSIFRILSQLPLEAAFVLVDALGNIDGAYLNPLRAGMGSIERQKYHPVSVAVSEGSLNIPMLMIGEARRSTGDLPEFQDEAGILLQEGYFPIHPHHLEEVRQRYKTKDRRYADCYVLMSKRSVMPRGTDYQLKLSFGTMITTRSRTLFLAEAETAVQNTQALAGLGRRNVLPPNLFAVRDRFGAQIDGDEQTTFMVRGRLNDLISNSSDRLPDEIFPVTAACIFSRNLLSAEPLLVDFAQAGVDPFKFFADIVTAVIHAQLSLMELGFIPEIHPQNLIYLIDKSRKCLAGLLIRDHEGAKIDTAKMQEHGILYQSKNDKDGQAISALPVDDPMLYKTLITRMLHRTVFHGNITPLMLLLHEHYGADLETLIKLVKDTYIGWWVEGKKTFKDYQGLIAPGFHQLNAAIKSLGISGYPSYRQLPHHPFIPTYEEMESILK